MKKKRVSGIDETNKDGMQYRKKAGENRWELDIDEIERRIGQYLNEAQDTGKYSMAGLCIALGITRETLDLWRMGYAQEKDYADAEVERNAALAECIAKNELFIHRYWEESEESKIQSKHIKLLESAGVIGTNKTAAQRLGPPFNLGKLKQYCK